MTGRLTALALSGALIVAVMTMGNGPAAALGSHWHHLVRPVANHSTAVEGAANMYFSCNDLTGAYKLKVRNVQVIQDDGVTPWHYGPPWDNPGFQADLFNSGGGWEERLGEPGLSQNSKNGLFEFYGAVRYLIDPASCRTGEIVMVSSLDCLATDDLTDDCWLNLQAALT